MPFSPRWLVHHGREEEARKVLSDLRGLSPTHELIELEFLEIKAQSLFEKKSLAESFPHLSEQTAWNVFKLQFVAIAALFKTKAMLKRVGVATVTMCKRPKVGLAWKPTYMHLVFQQWTGINAVLYCKLSLSNRGDFTLTNCRCPADLRPARTYRQYHLSSCYRCRWNRHVHRYYPRCTLD